MGSRRYGAMSGESLSGESLSGGGALYELILER
jgi:hypothetical protein